MEALLTLQNVYSNIGQFEILQGVSFDVQKRGVTVLLGRNGAGKTTTLKTIMGYLPAERGDIQFAGKSIARLKPFQVSRQGIGYMPEDGLIFSNLTVEDNLLLSDSNRDGRHQQRVNEALELFPDLRDAFKRMAGALSGGQRQMLGMASLLVANPDLLIIDEPSKGLSPAFVQRLAEVLSELKREKTILLVEQNFYMASQVADRFTIIDDGRTVLSGEMSELVEREDWKQQYLGVSAVGGGR